MIIVRLAVAGGLSLCLMAIGVLLSGLSSTSAAASYPLEEKFQ